MAFIDLNKAEALGSDVPPTVIDGIQYAHSAVQFASLALTAKDKDWSFPETHLYALSIELAFKSLALRSGANLQECRNANHDPSKMIKLIEDHGTVLPERIKTRLASKKWFQAFMFMSRYPAYSELNSSLDTTIFLHPDYPEMIAEILETSCKWPLSFEEGSALNEIRNPPDKMTMMQFIDKRGNNPH